MSDLLKSTFQRTSTIERTAQIDPQREQFRKRALESISGSMVFVEDAILYWDLEDE